MFLWQCSATGEKTPQKNTEHNGRQCPHFHLTSQINN